MSEYRKLERDEDKFVNPYHFVELGNLPVEKTDFYKSKGGNTGWIDIDIETLTPIFIPNTSNSNAFNKSIPEKTIKGRTFERKELKSYRFFSYQDLSGDTSNNLPYEEPVIPGSEIRGMIRSAFEAVTNSCLSTIDMKRPLYKRTIRTGTPGLLEYDNKTQKWVIYECIRIGVKMQELEDKEDDNGKKVYSKNDAPVLIDEYNEFKEMEKVFLEITKKKYPKVLIDKKTNQKKIRPLFFEAKFLSKKGDSTYKEIFDDKSSKFIGYIHKGEAFETKHHESIFIKGSDKPAYYNVSKESIENLRENIELYEGYGHLKYILNDNDIKNKSALVYYNKLDSNNKDNHHFYLSPAAIGREVFFNKMKNIIKGHEPCNSMKELCPACQLFGLVISNEEGRKKSELSAAASRIRFTDALIDNNSKQQNSAEYYLKECMIEELASPKPSATEFYLKRPEKDDLWNYDYSQFNKQIKPLSGYVPEIRGRKFYWHKKISEVQDVEKNLDYSIEEDRKKAERSVVIQPVKPRIKFKSKIYFDKIMDNDLAKLLWVLTLGKNEGNAHRIGMGKPLGLGSIRITVRSITTRKIQNENDELSYRLNKKSINSFNIDSITEQNLGTQKNIIDQYLEITNFEKSHDMVQYPSIKIKLPDRIVDSEKIYEWFMANKQSKDNNAKPNDPKILQPLPSDITTPYLYRFIDGKPSKSCINDLNKKRQNDKALGNKYARKLGINATGKIKFYKAEKNFGFIITDAGDDIYFNKQNIKLGSENLAPGDKVAFIIDNTNKKPEAIEVAKI